MEQRPPDSLADGIAEQVRRLVDREVGIAREELQDKASAVAADAALLIAAGVLGYGSLLAFLAAAIDAARGPAPLPPGRRPLWQGAALVGALLGTSSLALAAAGVARLRERDLLPRRTLQSFGRATEAAADSALD
jgi:putative superfamily III holin-X